MHKEPGSVVGLFGLLYYGSVHFWAYTGDQLRSMMPWSDERYEAQEVL